MRFEKSLDGPHFLVGDLKARKSFRLPVDLLNIIHSEFRYMYALTTLTVHPLQQTNTPLTPSLHTKAEAKHSRTADQDVVPLDLCWFRPIALDRVR